MFDGVALVTGAGSGLGQLMSWRLAAAGVTVAAVDVSEEGLARTARRAPQVRPHVVDVTDEAAVRELVAGVEADLGPIGRLVNAAAVAPTRPLMHTATSQMAATFGAAEVVSASSGVR